MKKATELVKRATQIAEKTVNTGAKVAGGVTLGYSMGETMNDFANAYRYGEPGDARGVAMQFATQTVFALGGAAGGGLVGSTVPVAGTAAGAIVGSVAGDKVGRQVFTAVTGKDYQRKTREMMERAGQGEVGDGPITKEGMEASVFGDVKTPAPRKEQGTSW